MNVVLDTSYLFPLIGIEIDKITFDELSEKLQSKKNHFLYVDISLFELIAKSMKMIWNVQKDNQKSIENVQKELMDIYEGFTISFLSDKLDGLLHFDNPSRLIWYTNLYIIDLLDSLRQIHSDFVDCVIFACAIVYADCFATMDDSFISKVKKSTTIRQKILEINPNFLIWKNNLAENPKPLFSI